MKRNKGFVYVYFFALFFALVLGNVNFGAVFSLPENFYASYSDIDNANNQAMFGSFVRANLDKQPSVSSQKQEEGVVIFKLFGFIPIRKVKVNILPEDDVYIGGTPIGLVLATDGAVVMSENSVNTAEGQQSNNYFKSGDILTAINGQKLQSLQQAEQLLQSSDGSVTVDYIRKNKPCQTTIDLLKTDEGYKLGLWVKDDVSGIGTLTYVKPDDLSFAALGHPITDGKEGNVIPISSGKIYDCSLVGISKGQRSNPGELKCVFMQSAQKGDIDKNNKYGVFGKVNNLEGLVDTNLTARLGGRLSVKPGKAKIVSRVSGMLEEYDIEIIKANYQSSQDDKSLVFRVTDKRLLSLTGGIVQGMSGSPIMQNGKLVGAVTHVFLSDPSKGYGVYSDWMVIAGQ